MREILFRGKRVDNGEWIYGYYHHRERDNEHVIYHYTHSELLNITHQMFGDKKNKKRLGLCMPKVDPKTVGQYTGLKDKNGVEIYESDHLSDGERTYRIMWDSIDGKWIGHHVDIKGDSYFILGRMFVGCELKGNKYE